MKYFFRGTPDDFVFPIWSLTHFLILAIAFVGVEFIVLKKDRLKSTNMGKIFKKFMIIILVLQQVSLYLWYGFSGYFTIQESLPFYNCRVAIIFTIFALVTDKKIFKNVGCYWGVAGAILALLLPTDLDPFSFPHYTNISFFIGHIGLLWSTIYILVVEEYRMDRESLRSILYFTNIYHSFIYIFNIVAKSNYCYLVEAPIAKASFEKFMSPMAYSLTAFLAFNIFIILIYGVAKYIYKTLDIDEDLAKFAS
ncbi:TIGR02206 family membrane protein [Tissierella pigra]|uniref:TIGR02206 family membrane protein n=1 Tax=Tissierella pigra TaxID=2607614 RepID=A0A6N7XNJ2_9FIRM|nr:TIGR02206 family membrane protein [Tissierella pigra]MBU5427364.1 TIGR02206 family membrane protein [Tissierella pigra]MSU03076.1 TIGR02206 family membrane protein [Tissierella pigra]